MAGENAEPAVEFPEFQGVLATHLETDLSTFVEGLNKTDDRLYGDLLLRALRDEGVNPPAMPEDVLRIQRLLSTPDIDVAPLAAAITRDPSIAGRFVGIANSPLYARADRVRTVDDAIVRIGMRQTSMIVMAIVSRTKLFRAPGHEDRAREIHRHCLCAAVAGQLLARRARLSDSATFMGGLMHDIGRIWLMSLAAELTRQTRGKRQVSPPILDAVSDRFHAGFGALVAEAWGFEDDVVAALMFHHAPSLPCPGYTPDMIPRDAYLLTYAISASDLLSHHLLDDEDGFPPPLPSILQTIGLEPERELRQAIWEAFVSFEQQLA